MTKRWFPLLLVPFAYLLLAIWVDSPFLLSKRSLFLADITYNVEPAARFARQCWLAGGRVPLWNPYVASGAPLAQVQWPLFYWPNWLFVFFPFPLATGSFLLLHQLVASVGGFFWQYRQDRTERSELKWLPAAIFGLAYMMSGYMAGSTINFYLFACAAWIPLALLLIESLLAQRRLWIVGLLGFVVGTQATAGRPELLACCLLLYLVFFIIQARAQPGSSARVWWLTWYSFCSALALAFILSAVDLLPMLEIAAGAPPSGSLANLGVTWWSAGWFDFLGIVLSQPVGELKLPFYNLYPTYPGNIPYITSLFLGAPVITLAAIGFAHHSWRQRWLWLAWGIIFAVLSTSYSRLAAELIQGLLPDLLVFRYPIKLSIFLVLAICCAQAQGLRVFLYDVGKGKTLLLVGLCWFVFASAGLMLMLSPEQMQLSMPWKAADLAALLAGGITRKQWLAAELVVAGLTGIVASLLFLPVARRVVNRRLAAAFWVVLVAVPLAVNSASHLWRTVDKKFFETRSPLADWFKTKAPAGQSSDRVLNLFEDPLSAPPVVQASPLLNMERAFMQYTRLLLRPNTNVDSTVYLSNGALTVPSWSNYFLYTGVLPRSGLQPGVVHPAGKSDLPLLRFCQATGTRFVMAPGVSGSQGGPSPSLNERFFRLVKSDPLLNLRIYEVERVRPRFSLQHNVRLAASRTDALLAINRCDTSGYDPEKMVIIVAPPGSNGNLSLTGLIKEPESKVDDSKADAGSIGLIKEPEPKVNDSKADAGSIRLISDSYDRLTLTVDALRETFLVLTDSWDPGWEAYDNGAATPVYLADGLMQAVHLNAGSHKLFLAYRPLALTSGAVASKAGLLVVCALLLSGAIARRFRRKQVSPEISGVEAG